MVAEPVAAPVPVKLPAPVAPHKHWAFQTPIRPPQPGVQNAAWVRNPIDQFILARLEREGISPSPEADRRTLIRRVCLDLTGLPPSPAQVEEFLKDTQPFAFERLVDRLLASTNFGEHFARYWLDVSRYGDTHGTHLDNYRESWPYRDYLIRAFNENMPYDRFLTEQLAGDLLPNPTTQQRVATGFLRNQVSTGDIDSLRESEARYAAVAGMAETAAAVFMGMTMNCARCHDHMYDPLTQNDYYRFYAYFNNNEGPPFDFGAAYPHPAVAVPTQSELTADYQLRIRIAELQKAMQEKAAKLPADAGMGKPRGPVLVEPYERIWLDDEPRLAEYSRFEAPIEDCFFAEGPNHPILSGKQSLAMRGGNQQLFWISKFKPTMIVGEGDVFFVHVWIDPAHPPRELVVEMLGSAWEHRAFWGEDLAYQGKLGTSSRLPMGKVPESGRWIRLEIPAQDIGLQPGTEVTGIGLRQFQGSVYWDKIGLRTRLPGAADACDTLANWIQLQELQRGGHLPPELRAIVQKKAIARTPEELGKLRSHYLMYACTTTRGRFTDEIRDLEQAEFDLAQLHARMARTLVFQEASTVRPTHFYERGEWDRPGEKVQRGTPDFLPAFAATMPNNRLGLAQWLTHPEHPLTARVAVNRFWQQIVGSGLVRSGDDFGMRSERFAYPELLDWLAVEFCETGWDVKRLVRLLATSATYRQSAQRSPQMGNRDPDNRLLARSHRVRLDAEVLRDQALALGGLLVDRQGGPSVKPPQPPGVWEAVATRNSNTKVFRGDTEPEKIYRRSMYTFWKRTAHSPQMSLLDAPSRETSICSRERTNTPLQALLLLNDAQLFEAARGLARRTSNSSHPLETMFELATVRPPTSTERAELQRGYEQHREYFDRHPDLVARMFPNDTTADSKRAALTMIANLILNLDEVLSRP